MKILVTGGGGFLGHYVVRALIADGYDVIACQRSEQPELVAMGAEVRRASLTDLAAVRQAVIGCDAVVHLAAKAGVWGPRHEYISTNVEGTSVLLEAMQEEGITKLVYCSSPSVVFDRGAFEGGDESLPYGCNWLCPYPESKALAEELVLDWGRAGHGKVIALRPHLIWGKGDPHLFPLVVNRSQTGSLRIIGDGRNRVDMTRVENAAAAHVLALKALGKPSAVNRAYFISQGESVPLWDWINSILKRLDVPEVRNRIPLPVAYCSGAAFEFVWAALGRQTVPPMTRFIAIEMARSHWFSIDAARQELGYRPEAFPTEEGLDAYAAAWKLGQTPTA